MLNLNLEKRKRDLKDSLNEYPGWVSGFTSAEGCFTGYLLAYPKAKWGLQLGLDFNITQSSTDKLLLQCISEHIGFDKNVIYDKPNNVSVLAVRNLNLLETKVIPYFDKYKLIGEKQTHYSIWKELVAIANLKTHLLDDNSKAIQSYKDMARLLITLNNRNPHDSIFESPLGSYNSKKLQRLAIIKNWLEMLDCKPTLKEKLDLKEQLKLIK